MEKNRFCAELLLFGVNENQRQRRCVQSEVQLLPSPERNSKFMAPNGSTPFEGWSHDRIKSWLNDWQTNLLSLRLLVQHLMSYRLAWTRFGNQNSWCTFSSVQRCLLEILPSRTLKTKHQCYWNLENRIEMVHVTGKHYSWQKCHTFCLWLHGSDLVNVSQHLHPNLLPLSANNVLDHFEGH